MQKISNPYLLSVVTKLFILLIVAKSISLFALWFLPSDGVNAVVQKNYKPKYQRVEFKNMLISDKQVKQVARKIHQSSNNGMNITNMILKGLYGVGSKGFAIIALQSSPKNTTIVSVGEEYSGYVLKTILTTSVIFIKADKEYVLSMQEESKNMNKMNNFVQAVDGVQEEAKVSREDIKYYAKNPDKIWKDISIVQMKNKQGFKITNIRKNSKMDALGLKKGDIMIRANNNDLKSYKNAIDLYKSMDKLHTIELVVLRNNKEKEFIYEIH
ncbi:MAG: PDZ domain-containing protein [Sulfurimonas sp.]